MAGNLVNCKLKRLCRVMLVCLLVMTSGSVMAAKLKESLSEEAIVERLTPLGLGSVNVVGEGPKTAAAELPPGAAVYQKFCSTCHEGGVAGAPKKGDKGAWGTRMAKGMEATLANAMKGIKAMPPMGTCMDCSKDDIQAAITFMIK